MSFYNAPKSDIGINRVKPSSNPWLSLIFGVLAAAVLTIVLTLLLSRLIIPLFNLEFLKSTSYQIGVMVLGVAIVSSYVASVRASYVCYQNPYVVSTVVSLAVMCVMLSVLLQYDLDWVMISMVVLSQCGNVPLSVATARFLRSKWIYQVTP